MKNSISVTDVTDVTDGIEGKNLFAELSKCLPAIINP